MFQKTVVIDARGHLLGRLASVIAKELLNGQKIVVVRAEEINISGSLFRNKLKWEAFRRKRMNTNPKKGPIHQRSPSAILKRVVRGMVPHKKTRGLHAMNRLQAFEGVPHPYDKVKRVVVPDALRNLRLKAARKYCRLGDLASHAGWKHNDLIERLESQRKVKSAAFYKKKRARKALIAQAKKNLAGKLADVEKKLEAAGHTL